MKTLITYLTEIFGNKPVIQLIDPQLKEKIPLFLSSEYSFSAGEICKIPVIFVEPATNEHFTPDQYLRHKEILETIFKCPVVFVFSEIEAFNRNRLVRKQVNFVVPGKQLFIPALAMDLKEYWAKAQAQYLHPAAQLALIYHLQKENLADLGFDEWSVKLTLPYLTISRAVANLKSLDLCTTSGTKEKKIHFTAQGAELWQKALPFMRNPVLRKHYTDDEFQYNQFVKSNLNALANYTNINDVETLYFAIGTEKFRKLKKANLLPELNEYDGKFCIEEWRYDPERLSINGFIDPLSTYLVFLENEDERIQLALKSLIEKMKW